MKRCHGPLWVAVIATTLLWGAVDSEATQAAEQLADQTNRPAAAATQSADTKEGTPSTDDKPTADEIVWHTDYAEAMQEAVRQKKMLFIFFHDLQATPARQAFEAKSLAPEVLKPYASKYVWAKVPLNAEITVQGKPVRLLQHASFREMLGRQGVAIVDLVNKSPKLYGQVVSEFPFSKGLYYTPSSLGVILNLPAGTLTQRTMIYAVRIHPEGPQGAYGNTSPLLLEEAFKHSSYQASIGVQGHHNWDSRFQQINSRLPGGLISQEVVAESWPDKTLVDACVDCVDSWRQSPGHWDAVRSRNRMFGFDIKRGFNRIWYATGLFAR